MNCNLSQLGANSGLHIIIFDELDAICKQRGTGASSTGVHDTVVNQLLSKIDGVEQLNNILVIGQYDHRELIQLTSSTERAESRGTFYKVCTLRVNSTFVNLAEMFV